MHITLIFPLAPVSNLGYVLLAHAQTLEPVYRRVRPKLEAYYQFLS